MKHAPPTPARGARHRLLLVEDHPVTREGLARLLNFEPDLEVCGQIGTAEEALAAVTASLPDLVIVDISLAGRSGLELLKDLSCRHPTLGMLVLSTHDETLYAERSLWAGARGYIMKSAPTDHILQAIRRVLGGRTYLSDRMSERLLDRWATSRTTPRNSDIELLSDRELEVFTLIGRGQSTGEIAAGLNLSQHTVATHRAHIQQKLQVESLNELICRAAQWVQSQG